MYSFEISAHALGLNLILWIIFMYRVVVPDYKTWSEIDKANLTPAMILVLSTAFYVTMILIQLTINYV
jgi:hypothetical protein